jgi:hypothetical protein
MSAEIEFFGLTDGEADSTADPWLSERPNLKIIERSAATDASPTLRQPDQHYWLAKLVYELPDVAEKSRFVRCYI